MPLMFKDLPDLKRYLEARREMARKQGEPHETKNPGGKANHRPTKSEQQKTLSHAQGMAYAFDEAIKAIEAFLTQNHEEEG